MKKLLGISLLAIMVVLTGCSSEETSSKKNGSATEAKTETKVQSRDDVELADNEILVIDEETGESEKVEAVETESTKGMTLRLPIGYQLDSLEESSESLSVTIHAPIDSYIMISPSVSDKDIVNKPTYQTYINGRYGILSKDDKISELDPATYKDSFIKNNVVYLVEFTPINESKREAYGGLVSVGDKFYDFEMYIGNSKYSDEVFDTTFGILAELR